MQFKKFPLYLIISGGILLSFSLIMGWIGFPQIVTNWIKSYARLDKEGRTYEIWKKPSSAIPIFMKFYLFNVTNPEEIKEGGKPRVTEIGPYTYMEKREKVDIEKGERNERLKYRQRLWLFFSPNMSSGYQHDILTFLNIPYVAMAKMTRELTNVNHIQSALDGKLADCGESLFKKETIRDFLFNGFSIKPFIDLFNDPIMKRVGKLQIPHQFKTGKFALYGEKNGSDDGTYEIYSGKDSNNFANIHKWNNMTYLPWWKNERCNQIEGTDGTIFPPFVKRNSKLNTFNPEICRSFYFAYEKDVKVKGLLSYRFTIPKKAFEGIHQNPDNECFCMANDTKICKTNGLLSLSACNGGSPIVLSQPHFHEADPEIISSIDGMHPMSERHKTFLDIEPMSGFALKAAKRLQVNVDLRGNENMPTFAKIRNLTFPVLWAEEGAEISDELLTFFYRIHFAIRIVGQVRWALVIISIFAIGTGVALILYGRDRQKVTSIKN